MSDYPGQQPDPAPDHEGDDAGNSEPTQPLSPEGGQPQQYPSYPPQYPPPQQPQYPQQPAAPVYPPYQQYQQPGQPGQPQYQQAYVVPGRPTHPKAGLALGLGIGGLVGGTVLCGLPLLLSPFAWAIGQRARKDIQRSGGQLDGDGMALAGMICGIVGTALLVLALLALIAFGVALTVGGLDASSTTNA